MSQVMASDRHLPGDLQPLARRCLVRAGASPAIAETVAAALVEAELAGLPSHGLARIPIYVEHLRNGRVDGRVRPLIRRPSRAVLRVDARHGFAAPAMRAAAVRLPAVAAESGIALASIGRAHLSGVLGHVVEPLAEAGLVALILANAPASIAAAGGRLPRFGTNPIAFALPRPGGVPLVIDLSMGVVTQGSIMVAAGRGEALAPGTAFDAAGAPTTDAVAALRGTIAPFGGAKGAVLAMAIDLLAGSLTGSLFSAECRPGFEAGAGPAYSNGVVIIAIHPDAAGAGGLAARVEALCGLLTQEPGVRLPGGRRRLNRAAALAAGIAVPCALMQRLHLLAEPVAPKSRPTPRATTHPTSLEA